MKRSLILTAFSFLVLAQITWAQVPQTISYQGVLKDNNGKIVADGDYDLTFRLYDASTGGAEWWSETHPGVPVADGIFNVILGSYTSFISTDPKTRFEIPYWLEIAVGESILSPRIQLTAVPYSLAARSVQGYMNVFPSKGSVGIGTTTPGSKLHIAGPDVDGIMLTDSISGTYRATLLNRETMGGQLNLNDAADGAVKAVIRGYATVDGWQASFTAGNVGIGTATPTAKLEVVGTVKADSVILPATTRYYSISPAAFNPSDNSTGFVRSYETIYSTMATGDVDFYAPANLPHGAVIKEMVAAFIDNHATETIVFDLRRMSLNSTGSDIIARCVSSGSSVAIQTVTESATTTVATVDNSSYTYVIHTYWFAPTIATDITVRSVKIVYEVTTPLP